MSNQKTLMRRYIGQRLADYYAQPCDKVVGSAALKRNRSSTQAMKSILEAPAVNFPFWGQWHWNTYYQSLFKKQSGQWLTPVELFTPYYSQIVTNFISSEMHTWKRHFNSSSSSFDIIELGGGRGTNAMITLYFLQQNFPHLFSNLSTYYIVESSHSLIEFQKQQILSTNQQDLIDKVQYLYLDIAQVAESKTYVYFNWIQLELLSLQALNMMETNLYFSFYFFSF